MVDGCQPICLNLDPFIREVTLSINWLERVFGMSDFFAFFSRKHLGADIPHWQALFQILQARQGSKTVDHYESPHYRILLSLWRDDRSMLRFDRDESFLFLSKGVIFDSETDVATLDIQLICAALRANDVDALLRYEGAFACCAWDDVTRRAFIFNDQVAQLNIYYAEYEDGLYVSTNALALARALGLKLDPTAVQEFLALGVVHCPDSMFEGLKRVGVGEYLVYDRDGIKVVKAWRPLAHREEISSRRQAVDRLKEVVRDRIWRLRRAASDGKIVCDMTAGYDSRLIGAACHDLGLNIGLTVNGEKEDVDVRIAHRIASVLDVPLAYFETSKEVRHDIEGDFKLDLLYRTSGELPFNEIYRHALSRPRLGSEYDLHFNGSGGELFRYYPWSQEFFGIGRRRLANVERALRYRYVPKHAVRRDVFRQDWYPYFVARLRRRILEIFRSEPRSLTTQQLDTAYLWKKTGNPTAYLSALSNWLPTMSPLLCAGVVEAVIALPWRFRLTSGLQRHVINELCPELGKVPTQYGGRGGPVSIWHLGAEFKQVLNRTGKLVGKLDRMILGDGFTGTFSRFGSGPTKLHGGIPDIFRFAFPPNEMRSAGLYNPETLRAITNGAGGRFPKLLVERMATIELLCRELDFEPNEGFLLSQEGDGGHGVKSVEDPRPRIA